MTLTWETLNKMKDFLAEKRIKHNVDYAFTYKYGEVHVLCHEVWEEEIREAANSFGINIKQFHTYPYQ